jgi:pimeloyl-ACP methyl ester carboxylesterase
VNTLQSADQRKETGYAPVNGLNMYYEITGEGEPLIYIPAAFAFSGITDFPELTKRSRVVQVDLQGHGRTADIDRPLSFAQHAEDVVALMRHLEIERANFFGWSYGGLIAMLIAMRHPERVGRVATYGSLFGAAQDAIRPDKFGPPVEQTPDGAAHQFEHALYAYSTIPNAELAVVPDATHFVLFDRPWKLEPIVAEFFSAPEERLPFGTIATGYHPGKTR